MGYKSISERKMESKLYSNNPTCKRCNYVSLWNYFERRYICPRCGNDVKKINKVDLTDFY